MFNRVHLLNAPTHPVAPPEFEDVVTGNGGGDVNVGEKGCSALVEFVDCGLEYHVSRYFLCSYS